ncbi:MAG TPA: hypothetical protein PLO37_09780 [Candidatus Hydrogenedentes bacterium]|nr:hypothetical protein [Candidatus Hydrogenedentota bacterium]HPG67122.1 hypothetical protein [Candidatus Hydrogenedentota bacterium]
MNALFEAAQEVGAFMAEREWAFCVIGGLAVQCWGEPRTTTDVDMTLLTTWGEEKPYVAALLDRFESRVPDGRAFALSRRVVLIRASNGRHLDIALGALPFEAEMMRRATPVEFAPGIILPCCTAEDLFVMKAFADRPRDWLDAESVIARQSHLDSAHILRHLEELCALKEAPEVLARAKHLLEGRS